MGWIFVKVAEIYKFKIKDSEINSASLCLGSLIDLNPVELNCDPFMISLDKCNGSYNVVDNLSTKICVPNETKDVNVKVFNMIARINQKRWVKRI